MTLGAEAQRLQQAHSGDAAQQWLAWGPYLSERQWGTVREDYSPGGTAWSYLPHDHARSRAYRWGEDGLAGLCDDQQLLCFGLALWNEQDPILKERLFGLTNDEGNHGEDVKECYFYLDNTPTHSYMKWLYKYPQRAYPYADLVAENARRKATDPHAFEYELFDTGVFAGDRYFDVQVEYAKAGIADILVKIVVTNLGPVTAALQVLPTLWFRNTWSWSDQAARPRLDRRAAPSGGSFNCILATPANGSDLAPMMLYCRDADGLLFCDNETNNQRLWQTQNRTPFPKDGINDHLVHGANTVNPVLTGTKAAAHHRLEIASQQSREICLRLSSNLELVEPFGPDFDATFTTRTAEASAFYADIGPAGLSTDLAAIQRQAYAGMLWSKQFYYYVVADWLAGDPNQPPPPASRSRNRAWTHFYAADVLSMPDKWEYPWFAAWDMCFQAVVFARLDAEFSKRQLRLLCHEWYMSEQGAVPAYEWSFGDVNPPLHAWAALRIFDIDKARNGGNGDVQFLADIFMRCLMYFTWWTNRKDAEGLNLFEGGFLGLDNISVVDRSNLAGFAERLGRPVDLYQSDGTSWMGLFCLDLMQMALRLAALGRAEFSAFASKFFQHFMFIADAMNSLEHRSQGGVKLWNEADGFYYDALKIGDNPAQYVSVELRSLVGVIALFPVAVLDLGQMESSIAQAMRSRMVWFVGEHPELSDQSLTTHTANGDRYLLSFVKPDRLKRILRWVFDESEFLGPHGVRGISRAYANPPYQVTVDGVSLSEQYEPAESSNGLFGGNSNWRGPVWFPINFLLIEALRRYHDFLGGAFTVEYPTGSGRQLSLAAIADDLSQRLVGIFARGANSQRPVFGGNRTFQDDPHWRDLLLFYEYFHGDNGAGIGASHQTGWTGLVAELLQPAATPQ